MGVYRTTAVKCGKTGYGLKAATIRTCSLILEKELDQFPNVRAYLLMGDLAIKAVNRIGWIRALISCSPLYGILLIVGLALAGPWIGRLVGPF